MRKIIFTLALIFSVLFLLGCTQTPQLCGDGICSSGEKCESDCGIIIDDGGIEIVETSAHEEISNALSAVKSGGQTQTQSFTMESGDLVTSQDFEENGFEAASILFGLEDFEQNEDNGFSVGIEGDEVDGFAWLRYLGGKTFVQANIICQATGSRLLNTLDVAGFENLDVDQELCLNGDDQIQPCCVVVLESA